MWHRILPTSILGFRLCLGQNIVPQDHEILLSQETYYACRYCLLIFELSRPWRKVMINTLAQSLTFLVSLIRSSGSGRFLWCSYVWSKKWTLASLSVMVLQSIILGQIFHFPHIPPIVLDMKSFCVPFPVSRFHIPIEMSQTTIILMIVVAHELYWLAWIGFFIAM